MAETKIDASPPRHFNAKLTAATVQLVREDYASGILTLDQISALRGVNKWTVKELVRRKKRCWKVKP